MITIILLFSLIYFLLKKSKQLNISGTIVFSIIFTICINGLFISCFNSFDKIEYKVEQKLPDNTKNIITIVKNSDTNNLNYKLICLNYSNLTYKNYIFESGSCKIINSNLNKVIYTRAKYDNHSLKNWLFTFEPLSILYYNKIVYSEVYLSNYEIFTK